MMKHYSCDLRPKPPPVNSRQHQGALFTTVGLLIYVEKLDFFCLLNIDIEDEHAKSSTSKLLFFLVEIFYIIFVKIQGYIIEGVGMFPFMP